MSMKSLNLRVRTGIALFLILILLHINFSCYYYTYTVDKNPSVEKLDKLKNSPNYLIIHQADQAYNLRNIKVDQQAQTLNGVLQPLPPDHLKYLETKPQPGSSNRYKKTSSRPGEATPYVVNEVHFYVNNLLLTDGKELTIPLSSIEKIEVYDPDTGATTASFILGGIGIFFGALLIVAIIFLLTKSSCPFLYVNNGQEFVFAGEIYSGAIFKSIERDDYLALPRLNIDSVLEIKISNKLKEQQFINQVGVLQVSHPRGTKILPDRYGKIHLLQSRVEMIKANVGKQDIKALIQKHDSIQFSFNAEHRNDYFNDVVITFPKPKNVKEGHLILNLKNSLWGDYVFGEFTKLFGSAYPSWIEKQNKKEKPDLAGWTTEQGLNIKVSIEQNNEWKYVDIVDLVGPLAFREVVVPIELTGNSSDLLKIRLSAGFMLWDLDYAGIDYTADENIDVSYLNPLTAIANDGTNALSSLTEKDNVYHVQKNIGDEVAITFRLAANKSAGVQDYVFHSRGYYNHVRDYKESPQVSELLSFKMNGRFSRFSKEKLDEMNQLMSVAEIAAIVK